MTMKIELLALLGFAVILTQANAQSAAPCPRDSSVTGYSSIEVLNSDMEGELQRIQQGEAPANEYTFRLCPDTVFDTTTTPLRPVLNNAMFLCGENGDRANSCTLVGGSEQIRFEDSELEGYSLTSMSFMGLSFADFGGNNDLTGVSIGAYASSTLTATFTNVAFTDFESNFVVRQTTGFSPDPPMTIEMRDVTVASGASGVIFDNDGGIFILEDASISDVTGAALIATANAGGSFLQDSSVSASSLNSVTFTTAAGATSVINTEVTQMISVQEVFYVEGAGSTLALSETVVNEIKMNAPPSWRTVAVQSQATATIDKLSVVDNQGLEYGISVTLAGTASMKDSIFENNQGLQIFNRTSAPIFGISDSGLNVERSLFKGNTGFSAVGIFLLRSTINLSRSCIQDGSSEFVVTVDSTSDFSVDMNFLQNYNSERCDLGSRLFKEVVGSGCFVGSGTCEGTCEVLADQAECRLVAEPTVAPSVAPPIATTFSPTRPPTTDPTQQPTVPPVPQRTTTPSARPTTITPTVQPTMPYTDMPYTDLPSSSPVQVSLSSDEPTSVPSEIVPTAQPSVEKPDEKTDKGKKSSKKGKKGSKKNKGSGSSKSGKAGKSGKKSKSGKKGKGGKSSKKKYTDIPAIAVSMSPTGVPTSSPSTTFEQQRIHEALSRQVVGRRQWRQFLQDIANHPEDSS